MIRPRRSSPARRPPAVLAAIALAVVAASGCMTVGPDYRRPERALPWSFQSGQPVASATEAAAAAADVQWWRKFGDPVLDDLVAKALERNTDLQAAIARIEEADAVVQEAGGALLPSVTAGGTAARGRAVSPLSRTGFRTGNSVGLSVSAAYEFDFWGRLKRNREAALAGAAGSRHALDVTRLTLAGLVSQSYFSLRSLDEQIELTRRTVESRMEQVRLFQIRLDGGSGSELDLSQAQTLRADALVQLRELQRQRAIAQNQLARLAGEPGLQVALPPFADAVTRMPVPPEPPVGLPSELLLRRPDVRQAEENLIAANARIGVARAAMFPSLSLTGALGAQSTDLGSLLDSGTRIWNIGFGLTVPIFNNGTLAAREAQAQARYRQLVASYQGALEAGFQDVSNALVSTSAARLSETEVNARAQVTRRSVELARARFDAGYSGYLDLLDAQRTNYAAELDVVRNRQARLSYAVDLFRAIAGGWPQ